ncbi:MAG TPA: hypothetical protein VKF40_19185 [Burkholderiales bacterium]|nr:hypothetical protein [Burkholderiales bacterium]
MRSMLIIGGGLLLLCFCVLAGRLVGGSGATALAVKVFIPLWFAVAALNMWIGVSRAGYTVGEELPIFALIFAVPAAAAGFVWWKFS